MSSSHDRTPRLRRIALGDLVVRRGHANSISPRVKGAIAAHISAAGLYPPLIVRPHENRAGKFEIIDGHHRADVLGELGAPDARCEVWPIDSDTAELYCATLNHLRGRTNAIARAKQIKKLIKRLGDQSVRKLLALTPRGLRQLFVHLKPPVVNSAATSLDLTPIAFHLPTSKAKRLNATLSRLSQNGRADGLMKAIRLAEESLNRAGGRQNV